MSFLLGHFNYLIVVFLMMGGLWITFSSRNYIKRMIGLALFQTSVGLFYISLGKVAGGTAAIVLDKTSKAGEALNAHLSPDYVARAGVDGVVYSNPLPHVLILTAIVVGVATLAVGLAIAVRVREAYGTVEAGEIAELDRTEAGPRA
ncbi:MAG: Na+/H+ antiporter subunit C [Alphaproteobacteria bacterium]|nr:Na+/H+ antiporter subunit C [Alphaproteobacteria bacterium]